MPTPRQQSFFSHVYSCSGPCGGQILVSVFFIFLFACVLRCLRPYLLVHCGCRHPPSSDFPWWSGVPTTSSLECGAGGVCPPCVSRHCPVSHSPVSGNVSYTRGLPLAGPGIGSTPCLGGMSFRISIISSGSRRPVGWLRPVHPAPCTPWCYAFWQSISPFV